MTDQPWVTRVRAVITDPLDALLLVEDGDRHRLPFVEVEGTDDELPTIRAALTGITGVEAIVVRAIERSVDEERRVAEVGLELEPLGSATPIVGAVWRSEAEVDGLLPDDDRALVTRYARDRPPPERPRWARRGWFTEAARWIETTLAAHGRDVTSPIEQISSWCISSILRAETNAGRVFFKATAPSPLFVDEGTVTQGLAAMFPGRVPMPIAVDPDRRWMLLDDFGPVVGWKAAPGTKVDMFSTFARMQLETTERQDELLELGAFDRRPAWLGSRIQALLDVPDLGLEDDERDRLSALGPRFTEMCQRLAAGPVPAALVHGDLHLSNVAGNGDGYVFFDWTDACLAHPFLDMLVVLFEEDAELRPLLRDAYLGVWAKVAPEDELLELWALAEPLAALNQVVSYRSIIANVERGVAPEFHAMVPFFLRKALAATESE